MRKTAQQLIVIVGWLLIGLIRFNDPVEAKIVALTNEASPTATQSITSQPTPIKENITEPSNKESSYRLESVLDNQKVGSWNGINSLKKLVRIAIDKGVSANTVVMLLLLPILATLISALHYLGGVSGFGIFMPTMIAITFMATGIGGGLILFGIVLIISLSGNMLLRKLKLHFWPARAINLMLMSVGAFGLMVVSAWVEIIDLSKISIFPVLFMVLLSEEFARTQLVKSKSEAKVLTVGTLVLSVVGAALMSVRGIQEAVLLNPELTILLVVVVNWLVGNYTGIRLMEIKRFAKAVRVKKSK